MRFTARLISVGVAVMVAAGAASAAGPGACGAEAEKADGKFDQTLAKAFATFCKKGGDEGAAADVGPKTDDKLNKIIASYNKKIAKLLPECDPDYAELYLPVASPVPDGFTAGEIGSNSDLINACDGVDNPMIP